LCGSIGFAWAWPSAAYDDVMESMTDWAFSWPISVFRAEDHGQVGRAGRRRERERKKLTLIVIYDIAEVVLPAVVRSTHAHGVVREVDVAVVA
jgi:hypothetical protein